jgi:hypothetical protein
VFERSDLAFTLRASHSDSGSTFPELPALNDRNTKYGETPDEHYHAIQPRDTHPGGARD